MPPEPLTTNNKASQRQHGPETKATFNETIEQDRYLKRSTFSGSLFKSKIGSHPSQQGVIGEQYKQKAPHIQSPNKELYAQRSVKLEVTNCASQKFISQTDLWKRKLSGFDTMQKSGRRPIFREKDRRHMDDRCVCTARSRHDD
ncbi:hypothetical protein TNIN_60791 [Trichonephila inaurata madagascariensis]|uniref:Uncharacterized protein n=1 Tax=Trichonephila inaurata madagascariensis TaxID=2747483 RepID=A0A8X6Y059_9ARAC|nr:hypothetical protein TNIN_60791 [Trichonephila inaurata madagascariensis]